MAVMSAAANRTGRQVAAAGVFAALAVAWTFPLVRHLTSHLPGPGAGDNVDFLWNFWWARRTLASHSWPFHTTSLFAPAGADLTLHTHTALPALVGATALARLPIVAAQNVTILVGLFLNGFCAYWLSWRITRDQASAVIGGIIFGGSPFIAAHLYGHFNLAMAWPIPLFAMAASEAIDRPTIGWAAIAGLLVGVTTYIDYYYVVYECVLALCLAGIAGRDWSVVSRRPGSLARGWAMVTAALLVIDVTVMAIVALTGGFDVDFGGVRLAAHDLFNPLQGFWVLLAAFLCFRLRPRIICPHRTAVTRSRLLRTALIASTVFLVIAAPIVWAGAGLFWRGEYVTPATFWRSAPKGIDLATVFLGNPLNGWWGASVRRDYGRFGINVVESTGWLGVVPMVLTAWVLSRATGARSRSVAPPAVQVSQSTSGSTQAVYRWSAVGLVFFVWALGPHLTVFGVNTGMPLPQALLRYVPIVANARIPGRAMVMVYLALSVLSAMAISKRHLWRQPVLVLSLVVVILIADFLPAPFPLVAMDHPAIYEVLRNRQEAGAVCELPLGIRDGLGERGAFDDRVLFYQTIHQRPLVGGFVARLPHAVVAIYEGDPLLAALLRLSARMPGVKDDAPLPDRVTAAERLRQDGIGFIVLNRASASAELTSYVERVLPVELIAEGDGRSLYLFARQK